MHGFPLVPIGATATLNDAEQRLARYLAGQRYAGNRADGVANGRRNPAGDEETDREGIAAEIAFGRLHNVYPDLATDARPHDDSVLPGGWRVDVKATTYPTGRLLVLPHKSAHDGVDLYALMVGRFPGPYTFHGFMSRDQMIRAERLRDLGHGPTYAADQSELRTFADLWTAHTLTQRLEKECPRGR